MSDTQTIASDASSTMCPSDDAVPTVIVFGTTGAGKSSVINMLPDDPDYDRKEAKAGFDSAGVTVKMEAYNKKIGECAFQVLDTIGTGESKSGRVPTHQAIGKMYDYLVGSRTGLHLVMLVTKAGRIQEMDECNYLLARLLFGDEVPVILVLTHLENVPDKDTWWDQQESKGKLALLPTVAVVSFIDLRGFFKPLHDRSKDDLSRCVAERMRYGPGFSLRPKAQVNRFIAALAALVKKHDHAAKFHAAMLQLLEDYKIDGIHAKPLAKRMQVTAALPVVIFVGAPGSGKSTIIDMLPDSEADQTSPHDARPSFTSDMRNSIKLIGGQRTRVIEGPGVDLSSLPLSTPQSRAIRALNDILIAHPFGVRLIVLSAKTRNGQLAPSDTTHYHLIRYLSNNRSPVALVMIHPATGPLLPKDGLAFEKRIYLPMISERCSVPNSSLHPSRPMVTEALVTLIKPSTDHVIESDTARVDSLLGWASTIQKRHSSEELHQELNAFLRKSSRPIEPPISHAQSASGAGGRPEPKERSARRGQPAASDITPSSPSRPFPPPTATVVAFGAVGTGKSSVINMLPNDPSNPSGEAVASFSARQATTKVQAYHKLVDGRSFDVLDTIGVGENGFSIPTGVAIERLYDYLIASPNGVHLAMLVVRAGRSLSSLDENAYLYLRYLFGDQVPIVLVITHLENEQNKDTWWATQRNVVLSVAESVGVVSCQEPLARQHLASVYNQSQKDLARFVALHLGTGPGFTFESEGRRPFGSLPGVWPSWSNSQKSLLRTAMLALLMEHDMDAKSAKSLVSKIRFKTPIPIVVFVGAAALMRGAIIDSFPEDDVVGMPAYRTSYQTVWDRIKIIKDERIRIIDTPSVEIGQGHGMPSKAILALHNTLVCHPLGIRLVVLVAETSTGRLSQADANHYYLIRRFCPEPFPVCLVALQKTKRLVRGRFNFRSVISVPPLEEHGTAARTLLEGSLADLVKKNINGKTQIDPRLDRLLLEVSSLEMEANGSLDFSERLSRLLASGN